MSLIKCPECGKDISDQCKTCPSCGYPLKKNKKKNKLSKKGKLALIISLVSVVSLSALTGLTFLGINIYKEVKYPALTFDKFSTGYRVQLKYSERDKLPENFTFPDKYFGKDVLTLTAFRDCNNLRNVIFPEGYKTIGTSFVNCTNLLSIKFPKSVDNLLSFASNCENLNSVIIDSENPYFYVENNCVINREYKKVVMGLTNCVIPSDGSVTKLGNDCFNYNTKITSLTIPLTIVEFGSFCFSDCDNLTYINYLGTKRQWAAINKLYNWQYRTPLTTINCSDGVYGK